MIKNYYKNSKNINKRVILNKNNWKQKNQNNLYKNNTCKIQNHYKKNNNL